MQIYEIVHHVQEAHRGLCTRISERSRKNKSVYTAHAAEPFTMNAESYGKPSPADHFVDYCSEYEAAKPGAGLMLSEMIAAELRSRFTSEEADDECANGTQRSLRRGLLKEFAEALDALDRADFANADLRQMKEMQIEVQDLVNKGSQVVGRIIAIIRRKELERVSAKTVAKFSRRQTA